MGGREEGSRGAASHPFSRTMGEGKQGDDHQSDREGLWCLFLVVCLTWEFPLGPVTSRGRTSLRRRLGCHWALGPEGVWTPVWPLPGAPSHSM